MSHIIRRSWSAGVIAALVALTPGPRDAFGQSDAAGSLDATRAPASDTLEDIVVTANKRSENVNTVGMSVTALKGSDDLLAAGVSSPADLAKLVPGFTVTQNPYGSAPVYTIRGVGFNDDALAGPPTVGVYVDEIPLPYPVMTEGAQLDVQRVEVLKGPQGVLFGENTTGGAVNYIAASPTSTYGAGAYVDASNFGRVDTEGYVSGPINDSLGIRIAIRSENGGAWQESQSRPGDRLGTDDNLLGRIIVDWHPSSDLSVRLNVNGWYDKSATLAPQAVAENLLLPLGPIPPLAAAYKVNGGPDGSADSDTQADWGANMDYVNNNYFKQASLRGDYQVTGRSMLTSITAWSGFNRNSLADNDGTYFQSTDVRSGGNIQSFFQELRYAADITDKLHGLLGANFTHDVIRDDVYLEGHASTLAFLDSILPGFPSNATGVYTGSTNVLNTNVNTPAGFVDLDYRVTDTLKLIGAVRYTDDKRDGTACSHDNGSGGLAAAQSFLNTGNYTLITPPACFTDLPGTITPGVTPLHLHQDNTSWRTGIDWQFTPDALLYATVNKGYKAGSFPQLVAFHGEQYIPAVQESLLAYEIGSKVSLLEHRLEITDAIFYYDYTNKQVEGKIPVGLFGPQQALVNIPKSSVRGAELDIAVKPWTGAEAHLGASYVDTKFANGTTQYDIFGNTHPGNLSGEAFPNTPKWQVNPSFTYQHPINANLVGFGNVLGNIVSATNGGLGDYPVLNIPSYTTFDLRAGIAGTSDKWRVNLFMRNAAGKVYWTEILYTSDTIQRFMGLPRTFGVSVSAYTH